MKDSGIEDISSLISMMLLYPVDDSNPTEIDASLYGSHDDIVVEKIEWTGSYSDLFNGLKDKKASRSYFDEDEVTFSKAKKKSSSFNISMRLYRHKDAVPSACTVMFLPGVPVNKEEFTSIAWRLSHICNVLLVDPLGQGRSSVPQDFPWSWRQEAEIIRMISDGLAELKPALFPLGKYFLAGNDWGTGTIQKFMEIYGEDYLFGANLNNAVTLDGYWVLQIGGFKSAAITPYPSKQFSGMVPNFVGQITSLLETMSGRSDQHRNQYSQKRQQKQWFYTDAYSDPEMTPANAPYFEHRLYVLAQKAVTILGRGYLQPRDSKNVPNGIDIRELSVPMQWGWGGGGKRVGRDRMMPDTQIFLWNTLIELEIKRRIDNGIPQGNLRISTFRIPDTGHFMVADAPDAYLGFLIPWMRTVVTPELFNKVFLGFDGIAKQNERAVIPLLSALAQVSFTGV